MVKPTITYFENDFFYISHRLLRILFRKNPELSYFSYPHISSCFWHFFLFSLFSLFFLFLFFFSFLTNSSEFFDFPCFSPIRLNFHDFLKIPQFRSSSSIFLHFSPFPPQIPCIANVFQYIGIYSVTPKCAANITKPHSHRKFPFSSKNLPSTR